MLTRNLNAPAPTSRRVRRQADDQPAALPATPAPSRPSGRRRASRHGSILERRRASALRDVSRAHHAVLNNYVEVVELHPGSFFGEMSLLDPEHRRSARAVVRDTVQVAGWVSVLTGLGTRAVRGTHRVLVPEPCGVRGNHSSRL